MAQTVITMAMNRRILFAFQKMSLPGRENPRVPMFNLPPFTKFLIGIIIAIHLCVWGVSLINPEIEYLIYNYGGFIPASWSGTLPFMWWTPFTLLSFSFLHGGWLHLGVNTLMMMAFGSGVEKWLGWKRMLILFAGSSITAVFFQFISAPNSPIAVIGASGAISGFFWSDDFDDEAAARTG